MYTSTEMANVKCNKRRNRRIKKSVCDYTSCMAQTDKSGCMTFQYGLVDALLLALLF